MLSSRDISIVLKTENQWKSQWRGDFFFAHGSPHSRGVDFELKSVKSDEEGRFILLEAIIQDVPFLLLHIYAPNTTTQQSQFFEQLPDLINEEDHYKECKILLGGDFNVTLDPSLDGLGGNQTLKYSVKRLDDTLLENELIDIWRIRNPACRSFTWETKISFHPKTTRLLVHQRPITR